MNTNFLSHILLSGLFLFLPWSIIAQWSELGGSNSIASGGLNSYRINSMCKDGSGNLYAAGQIGNSFGNTTVAKYNGSSWSELGGPNSLAANSSIFSVCSNPAGNVYAGGGFTNGSSKRYVARFDGNAWNELGGTNSLAANDDIYSIITTGSGDVLAAGWFKNSNGKCYVARFDGNTWSELGGNNSLAANEFIKSICTDPAGNVYAAGAFTNSNGKQYVAKWNGSSWSELGGNNSLAANQVIVSICSDASGNIYAAGRFTNGVNSSSGNSYVARWNGSTWSELGIGNNALSANSSIEDLEIDAIGNVYAAGDFFLSNTPGFIRYVAKWNGSSWSELGGINSLSANGTIFSLFCDSEGKVFSGGGFTNAGFKTYVARYENPSSIQYSYKTDLIDIYPNPFTSSIHLSADSRLIGSGFTIYSQEGKAVYAGKISERFSHTVLSHLPSGLYLLKSSVPELNCIRLMKETE
jgi:hypothetical protein